MRRVRPFRLAADFEVRGPSPSTDVIASGTSADEGDDVEVCLGPGTYTIEAWHEKLGATTQSVTIGAKESKEVSFTFDAAKAAAD